MESTTTPFVSVVIAVYNGETYVARAIDSVLDQDYRQDNEHPYFEIIVVDDASSDLTPKILGHYDSVARIIRKKTNHGLAAARNLGVAVAKGELIAFLDADDVWLRSRLSRTVAYLEDARRRDPGVVMAFSDVVPVDDRNVALAPNYIHAGLTRSPTWDELLEGWWPILPSTVLIDRAAFNKVGGFTEDYRGAAGFEDAELWMLLRKQGEFVCVPEPVVLYRLTPFVERMRKYAPGFGLFRQRMRERYGSDGETLGLRCAALYRWMLTVKGLRCLETGEMTEARRALFCALNYQDDPTPPRLRHHLHALLFANGVAPQANGGGTVDMNGVRRALYSMLPRQSAVEMMRRKGLLEVPPPPPTHAGFARELLAGELPLALY
jgi:glycosyltransferase involved in cell wall biosynthesis